MRVSMQRKWIIIWVLIIILLVCLGLYYFEKGKFVQAPTVLPAVVVSNVSAQNIPLAVSSFGNLVAADSTMLKVQQAGVVSHIYFTNGEVVKQGAILVQLDDASQSAAYNKDSAALYQAQMQYNRFMKLNAMDPSVLSKMEIDQVYANYQEAKAVIQEDNENLAKMRIVAPFSGRLGVRTISVGAFLNEGGDVVAIVNPNDLEVSYPVPESNYALVSLGQKVTLTNDAYPNKIFNGTVVYKSPFVDSDSRSFTVRARVDNPTGLASGMLVHVLQILVPQRIVLAVPTVALVSEMSGTSVYEIRNGKVQEVFVQTGASFGDYTEITQGLQNGDSVVVQGVQKVQPGMMVEVIHS